MASTDARWTQSGQEKLAAAEKLFRVAATYAANRDFAAAHRVLNDSLRLRRQILLPYEAPILECIDFESSLYSMTSDHAKCSEKLRELQLLTIELYGDQHPEVLHVTERLYVALLNSGEDEDAEKVSELLWSWRGLSRSTNVVIRSLEENLQRMRVPDSLQERIDLHISTTPVLKVDAPAPRTSRFLDPDWSPMKELELAKAKRDGKGKIPSGASSLPPKGPGKGEKSSELKHGKA